MFLFASLFFNLYMYNNLGKSSKTDNTEYTCISLNKDNKTFTTVYVFHQMAHSDILLFKIHNLLSCVPRPHLALVTIED